jgi:hypothetical protein
MFLNLFLNESIRKASKSSQTNLIIPCASLGEAFFMKEQTEKELKWLGPLSHKTDLSLSYASGIKLVFCNRNDVDWQKKIYPDAVIIKYLKIKMDYIFYSLFGLFCFFVSIWILLAKALMG